MTRHSRFLAPLVAAGAVFAGIGAQTLAQTVAHAADFDELTGDTKTACEAILCLSSGGPPHECDPALKKYFNIKKKKMSDTLKARQNFLELCPASDDSSEMRELVKAISRGAGRCDAASLNQTLRKRREARAWEDQTRAPFWEIASVLPGYCSAYAHHAYTDLDQAMPRYVGKPKEDGYWVRAGDYDRELAKYQAEQAKKKAEEERRRRNRSSWGN